MWYFVCSILSALVIIVNSKNRKSVSAYIIASFIMPTIGISLWYCNVKSKSKEKVHALTKAFAISHSIMCLFWLLSEYLLDHKVFIQFYHQSQIFSSGLCLLNGSLTIVIMWSLGIFFPLLLGAISKEA
jgi:hypothetical protein